MRAKWAEIRAENEAKETSNLALIPVIVSGVLAAHTKDLDQD